MAAPRRPDGGGRARRGGAEALSPALGSARGPAGGRFWTAVSSLWPFGGGGGRDSLRAPEPPGLPGFGRPSGEALVRGPAASPPPPPGRLPPSPWRKRAEHRALRESALRSTDPGPGGRTAGPADRAPRLAGPTARRAVRSGGAGAAAAVRPGGGVAGPGETCGGMSGLPPTRAALHAADAPSAARPPGVRGDERPALRCLPAPPPALLSAIHFSEEKQAPKAEVPSSSLLISACQEPGQR